MQLVLETCEACNVDGLCGQGQRNHRFHGRNICRISMESTLDLQRTRVMYSSSTSAVVWIGPTFSADQSIVALVEAFGLVRLIDLLSLLVAFFRLCLTFALT